MLSDLVRLHLEISRFPSASMTHKISKPLCSRNAHRLVKGWLAHGHTYDRTAIDHLYRPVYNPESVSVRMDVCQTWRLDSAIVDIINITGCTTNY